MRTVEGCSKCHRTLSIWRYEEPTQSRRSGGDCGVCGGVRTLSLRGSTALLANSLRQERGKKKKKKKKNFTGSVSPTSTHNNNTSSRFRSRLSSLEKANYSAARGARGEVSLRSRDDGYSPPFPRADTRKLIKIKVVSRKPREQLASLVFACLNK